MLQWSGRSVLTFNNCIEHYILRYDWKCLISTDSFSLSLSSQLPTFPFSIFLLVRLPACLTNSLVIILQTRVPTEKPYPLGRYIPSTYNGISTSSLLPWVSFFSPSFSSSCLPVWVSYLVNILSCLFFTAFFSSALLSVCLISYLLNICSLPFLTLSFSSSFLSFW